jgi:hypothetical protein
MNGQTYANHRYRPRLWLVTQLMAVIGFILILLFVLRQPSVVTVGLLFVATSLMLAVFMMRRFALRLQNRIIRLEMQTRLARLGRLADCERLTVPQLVALRFAADTELPALIDRTLADQLEPDQIKRAVTAWQGDDMRT